MSCSRRCSPCGWDSGEAMRERRTLLVVLPKNSFSGRATEALKAPPVKGGSTELGVWLVQSKAVSVTRGLGDTALAKTETKLETLWRILRTAGQSDLVYELLQIEFWT